MPTTDENSLPGGSGLPGAIGIVIGVMLLILVFLARVSPNQTQHDNAPSQSKAPVTAPEVAAIPPVKPNEEAVKPKPLTPKEKVALRKFYAKLIDQGMLHLGYDVEISDIEGKRPYLRIKYILMTRALAYQLTEKLDVPELSANGFTRVMFTDGYDDTWTVKLE